MKYLLVFWIIIVSFSCKSVTEFSSIQKIESYSKGKFTLTDGKTQKLPKANKDDQTIIYLVRHAEKESGKGDVRLKEIGRERANKLSEILKYEALDKVYSTRYNRTQETAEPTATHHKLNIEEYNPGKLEEFGKSVLQNHQGERILIVGHSNTTPKMLNYFMGEETKEMIKESDYENLYVISISPKGKKKALLMKF